jgi:hypothetical protein
VQTAHYKRESKCWQQIVQAANKIKICHCCHLLIFNNDAYCRGKRVRKRLQCNTISTASRRRTASFYIFIWRSKNYHSIIFSPPLLPKKARRHFSCCGSGGGGDRLASAGACRTPSRLCRSNFTYHGEILRSSDVVSGGRAPRFFTGWENT